jgi:hypothetical protein
LSTPYQLRIQDTYDPRGPDGRGRNRLRIEYIEPTPRCALRPRTKAAALDLWRGMARFGNTTAYAPCIGESCQACPVNSPREAWQPGWVLSEDTTRGGVWLMGSTKPDAFGYYYRSWEPVARSMEVPKLTQVLDAHWGTLYRADETPLESSPR